MVNTATTADFGPCTWHNQTQTCEELCSRSIPSHGTFTVQAPETSRALGLGKIIEYLGSNGFWVSVAFIFNKICLIVRLYSEFQWSLHLTMISQNSFMSCFQHTISLSVFLYRVQVPASLKDPPQHCYPQWRRGGWVRRFFKKETRINRDASLLTLKRNSLLYRTVKLNIPSYFKKGVFA